MTSNNLVVRKHRARMAEEGLARMEIALCRTTIKELRKISRRKGWPFWLFVERALIAYATSGNGGENDANRQKRP